MFLSLRCTKNVISIDALIHQVGLELRELLASVDRLIPLFPAASHRQVEMAHKVLSKDMSDLVNSMKLAQKYNNTTVEGDYRKYVTSIEIFLKRLVCKIHNQIDKMLIYLEVGL